MLKARAGVALATTVLHGGHVARADDRVTEADVWAGPHLAAAVHAGLFGPLGMLGAEVEVSPLPWLAAAVGYGTNRGLSASFGGTSSHSVLVTARGRIPIASRWSVVVAAGYSRSNWEVEDHPLGESPYAFASWDQVSWLDLEAGVERHWRHVELRLYVGDSRVLAKHDYSCDSLRGEPDCPYAMTDPVGGVFVGLALGYAIGL